MSSFLNERVPRVPPLSLHAIELLAGGCVAEFCPERAYDPGPQDLVQFTDVYLRDRGVLFYPASSRELPDQHASTDPAGSGAIVVLMREESWDRLGESGPGANHARSTGTHESGHAILHVPYIRRVRALAPVSGTLNRVERQRIPAFEDPEWQAWAWTRCFLMPTRAFRAVAHLPHLQIARVFNVSEALVRQRKRDLRLP